MKATGFAEKVLHRSFQIGILFKGIDGLVETLSGILFVFISSGEITRFVYSLTRGELLEDPDDLIANSLRRAFAHLSTGSKLFVGAYLLGHGVIKLVLVAGLWRKKLWVFPIATIVLGGFVGYQVYRLTRQPSIGLFLLTVLDTIIGTLVWHEYRSLRKRGPRAA